MTWNSINWWCLGISRGCIVHDIQQIIIAMFMDCMYINIVVAFLLHVLCASVFVALYIYNISLIFLNSIQKMLGVIVTFDARPTLTSQRVKVPKAISLLDMTSSQGFRSLGFPMIKKYWSVQKIGECRNTLQKRHLNRKKMMISQTIGVQYFQANTSHDFP